MNIGAIFGWGCPSSRNLTPPATVTLPHEWERWTPGKGGTADTHFKRASFVRHVRDVVTGTANACADDMSPLGHVGLRDVDANAKHLPDGALHFYQYTGHRADVNLDVNRASGEVETAGITVRRAEGHAPRQFSLRHDGDNVLFTFNDRTVSVTPNGTLQEA